MTSQQNEVVLRPPSNADAAALSALLGELGYPTTPSAVPARLAALATHPGALAWVAELDGRVVGVVSVHMLPAIHMTEPVAYLTALVVGEAARGRGVGQLLVARAEEWALARGASRMSLTSALHRTEAHAFYEKLGYERTGLRLTKTLKTD